MYLSIGPIYVQDGKYYYQSDPVRPGEEFPIGMDPNKHFSRKKGLGSYTREEITECYFNPSTRRLIQVTPEGLDYSMALTEDITERKKLLYNTGIISNPYGLDIDI